MKRRVSIDTDSGPHGYVLWSYGSRSQDFFTFIQIGSGHTVTAVRRYPKKSNGLASKSPLIHQDALTWMMSFKRALSVDILAFFITDTFCPTQVTSTNLARLLISSPVWKKNGHH